MLSNHSLLYDQGQHGLLLTSLALLSDGSLMASAVSGGLFKIDTEGRWFRMNPALPDDAAVIRLETDEETVYACTNKGLFILSDDCWTPTRIKVPCHRLRGKGGVLYAATDSGLWYRFNDSWVRTSYTDDPLYDLFQTPQMIFMAQTRGITVFDRYTQSMSDFRMNTLVSSLCVLNGNLLGASGAGDLMVADRQGQFELVRYGRVKIFSLSSRGGRVYACTDRGLYRLLFWKGKYHLCSVKLGAPVTDVVFGEEKLYLATYFEGIRTISLSKEEAEL